jgi:acetyl-CoA/propionyl-CoA carboxylase carboxyl transferase subunit
MPTPADGLLTPARVTEPDPREPHARLSRLLDTCSLVPLHQPDGSGVMAVRGTINGEKLYAYCTDATRLGGAIGADAAAHIVAAIRSAVRDAVPVIGIWHSGGAKLADGVLSMEGMGRIFVAMTRASGRIAQISVVVGPAAGAAAYGPALTDITVMCGTGRMFVTGPDIVRSVTGQQTDMDALGGADAHGRRSGVVHVTTDDEDAAYRRARRLFTFLARPGRFEPSLVDTNEDLSAYLPGSARRAYDVHPLIRGLLDADDDGPFEELQGRWARNVVVGLGRLAGRSVGVVASNPLHKGGCLDSLSAEKAARFVRMCDSFGVPLLVVVDVPGYLPGVQEEWGGVVRRGAKLLHAFAESVVPRVTLVTRKAYGGAYIAMNSRSLGATAVFAWRDAELAVMGADAAVALIHRRKLAAATAHELPALRAGLLAEHIESAGGVHRAVELGVVDEVIDPAKTRRRIAEALADAPYGRGRHGNIPL